MNFRGTLGGLGLMLMAWPALGQGLQQPYSVAGPDVRFGQSSGVMPASYSALASDDAPPPPPSAAPSAPVAPAAPATAPAAAAPGMAPETIAAGDYCASCNNGCQSGGCGNSYGCGNACGCGNSRGCGNSCRSGCNSCCCCSNMWEHETGIFAEYLYLRP